MTQTLDKHMRGLYGKFRVERTDGQSEPGEKHEGCEYFVLDLSHDPFAYQAIIAYSHRCCVEYPELASDLLAKASKMGEWMAQKHWDEMSEADRQRWAAFVHNDPERR